jgi:hypothetical protein
MSCKSLTFISFIRIKCFFDRIYSIDLWIFMVLAVWVIGWGCEIRYAEYVGVTPPTGWAMSIHRLFRDSLHQSVNYYGMGDFNPSIITGWAAPIRQLLRDGWFQSIDYYGMGCTNPSIITGWVISIHRLLRDGLHQSLWYCALSGLGELIPDITLVKFYIKF